MGDDNEAAAEFDGAASGADLIPGSPGALYMQAQLLTGQGETFSFVGNGLGRVDSLSWTGQAANNFHESFSQQRPHWYGVSDSLSFTAGQLSSYADTLGWAQRQADEALGLWNDAKSLTDTGDELFDPGAELRQSAIDKLNRARSQLDEVGQSVADAINGIADFFTPANFETEYATAYNTSELESDFSIEGGFNIADWETGVGPPGGDPSVLSVEETGSKSWSVYNESGSAEADWLGGHWAGEFDSDFLSAGHNKSSEFNEGGLDLGLGAEANVFDTTGSGQADYGPLSLQGEGSIFAGAEAHADFSVGLDGLDANAGAFVGGKAGLEGSVGMYGVSVGANAEGWAGYGAEVGLEAGRDDDGTWTLGGNIGAAPGYGGNVGLEVSVDPEEFMDSLPEASETLGSAQSIAPPTVGPAFGILSSIPDVSGTVDSMMDSLPDPSQAMDSVLDSMSGAIDSVTDSMSGAVDSVLDSLPDIGMPDMSNTSGSLSGDLFGGESNGSAGSGGVGGFDDYENWWY